MSYIITIQYPYQYLTITLSDTITIIAMQTVSKFQAISLLIPTLQTMLIAHNITLADIACIGVNTGPGPFNTLRSIIATANGISFAKQIPLVGCNGLDLILQEHDNPNAVAILDAFGIDVYFAIKLSGKQGYNSIENLITELNNSEQKEIIFIGNGVIKHKEFITSNFTSNFTGLPIFPDVPVEALAESGLFATTQSLVNETYSKFSQDLTKKEIFPLYFASPVVKS